MNLFKFYGVDWALFILIVTHLWMLGNKWRAAFFFGIVASIFGFVLGLMIGSVANTTMNIVFAAMHIRAYYKWSSHG